LKFSKGKIRKSGRFEVPKNKLQIPRGSVKEKSVLGAEVLLREL
jgi:hypothetical protein